MEGGCHDDALAEERGCHGDEEEAVEVGCHGDEGGGAAGAEGAGG